MNVTVDVFGLMIPLKAIALYFVGFAILSFLWPTLRYLKIIFDLIYRGDGDKVGVFLLTGFLIAYLVIIASFGVIYHVASFIAPDSFSYAEGKEPSPLTSFYFSVVTVTSTGYGDVSPKSSIAMIAAMIEMLLGQVMNIVSIR